MKKKTIFATRDSKLKKNAFTLAETLIVIGIIGVVAALTLPNLNHATGDKEKVTKVKKIYSALTDAVDRAQAIYGPMDEWFDFDFENNLFDGNNVSASANELAAKRITEFMKVSKDCGFGSGCFSSSPYLNYDGQPWEWADNLLNAFKDEAKAYMVTLSDGTSLAIYMHSSDLHIKADIDGPNKGKNQTGNDIFAFSLSIQSKEGWGASNYLQLTPECKIGGIGDFDNTYDITKWVIENGNLDYLKCEGLNWNTATTCDAVSSSSGNGSEDEG